jgi:hypothetical protein
MSYALGLTAAGDAPRGAILAPPGQLAIVTAPADAAPSARARLVLQVAYARDLPVFLPFRPREPVEISAALEHVAKGSGHLTEQVEACRGLVQITVALVPPTDDIADASRTWLRRRAAALERRAAATARVVDHLRRLGPRDIHSDGRGGLVHVIGDRRIGKRIHAALASVDAAGHASVLRGFSVTVTGPWPVFATLHDGVLP